MTIISFIIIFIVLGYIIGLIQRDDSAAVGTIIVISVLWAFVMGPWAIATFIELYIGYSLARATKKKEVLTSNVVIEDENKCANCLKVIDENDNYCIYCGTKQVKK
ncbi:hypothetical protein SAMN06313540_10226 [Epsilonproteobacteria bacterium SCGC AD-308-E02]|nr:hypothetical protein SAMN06313540_10226 [Epsilonproteobacteria bacterium SCGC AD-308-E02]